MFHGEFIHRPLNAQTPVANAVQQSSLPAETPAFKICAATARRLLEIARRNEIRREAKLPLLPIAKSYAG
jgi:hypothetical protein